MNSARELSTVVAFAAVGGLAAAAAHAGRAAYHDGLRPLLPDYRAGKLNRRDLGSSVWSMSAGFVWWFSAPFVVVTGVGVSHALFLPADTAGVRGRTWFAAVAGGALAGVAIGAVVVGLPHLLAGAPTDLAASWRRLVLPLRYLVVLLPIAAAHEQAGRRRALPVASVTLATWAVAAHAGVGPAGLTPSGVALAAGTLALLVASLARRTPPVPRPAMLRENLLAARRSLVLLVPMAAIAAWLAHGLVLAGDPGAALLAAVGLRHDAAAVALFSTVAFFPAVVRSMSVSGAASTQGIPDWVLGVGLVAPSPATAAVAGAAAIIAEVACAPWLMRVLDRHPELAGMGSAMRQSMVIVFDLAVLIGGVFVAQELLAGFGPVIVVGLWLWNEANERPLMPIAVGALGVIGAGVCHLLVEVVR